MELTAAEAWAKILDSARERLPEQTFRTWFARTRPVALSQDLLVIEAGSEFATEWIEDKYGRLLGDISADVFGRRFTISFQHHAESRPARPGAAEGSPGTQPGPESGAPAAAASSGPASSADTARPSASQGPIVGSPLNERYVFDRFVVGSNNQLAAAACRAVAEAPAKMYNPLFIYGGVGLGKTHLMHAIGHVVRGKSPEKRVAYVTSERFTNDLIGSIQDGRMSEFRRRYREIDLLLIDDVQFLGEKERTQEEFFHTFNSLYDAQRQIVVTSDRPPKEINGLEERLVSRFEWGLVTDIRPPDLETRVAILRKKADDDDIVIHDDVLEFIARYCRSSVRELEGAIIKLLAYSSLTHREVTTDLAREALAGQLADAASLAQRTPVAIRQRVAEEFGVTVEGLTSKRRTKDLTVPRQVAMYLMRELLELPLVEIGKQFGGRDHSTVIHSIQKVEQEMGDQEAFRQRVTRLHAEFSEIPPPL